LELKESVYPGFLKVYSQTEKSYFGCMKLEVFCFGLNIYRINSAIIA